MLGCVRRGPEPTLAPLASAVSKPPVQRKKDLERQLLQNPKDVESIADLAGYFLKNGEPNKALLMAGRGREVEERDPRFANLTGMAHLYLGDAQAAYFALQEAVEAKHPYAAANLAALLVDFEALKKAAAIAEEVEADDLPSDAPDLHPNARAALSRLGG